MQDTEKGSAPSGEDMPVCPACGSRKVRRIAFTEKLGLAFLKGERAFLEMRNTFRCSDCGKEW
ncbi:transposase [Papillibacter cinnamivorans]|uniref:transposase n=1 Tax=Papillibacter cinnamivorans TaxID=100176 RepID=UPI0009FED94A|nr:transposase [Papillibacter cinnamivorans]